MFCRSFSILIRLGWSFFEKFPHLKLYESISLICKFKIYPDFWIMKSKDLQKIVRSEYQNGDSSIQIYHDLNGGISLRTIERWCQMIYRSGSITSPSPPGCSRLIRTKENIQKVKYRLRRKTMNISWKTIDGLS